MNMFTALEGTQNYSKAGANKTKLSISKMIIMGMMSGFILGVAAAATNMGSFTQESTSVIRLVSAIIFGFGLGCIIVMGMELFTGNTLIVISVLDKKATVGGLLLNWVFVYIGNFLGSMLFAFAVGKFNWMAAGDGALADYTMKVAQGKMTMPFQNAVVMGILCNMLVTIAVFISLLGKDLFARLVGAWVPIMFFVLCGFNHSIADMTYCMMGLFAKSCFPEQAANYTSLTWGNYFMGNMIPVTIGNIIGGVLVGVILWYCFLKKDEK